MRRILIYIITGILLFTAAAASADMPEELIFLKNGIMPETSAYRDVYYSDYSPEDHPEGWEIRDGILYDNTTKTAVIISDEANHEGTVTIEPGTRYICADAFNLTEPINEVFLPDGLEVIGQCAMRFYFGSNEAEKTITVHVPASVRLIQEPLGGCTYSMACIKPLFIVDENNPRYSSTPDGLLIDKMEGAVIWCASFPETRAITVPEGIRRIAPYAFAGCHEIISVSLPDSLVEIGEGAFDTMFGLTELTIPENVLRIGACNFCWVGKEKNEQWCLDENGRMVIGPADGQDDRRRLTDEEALRKFGINRRPGLTFKGTEFLLGLHLPVDDYPYDTSFEPCNLQITCPASAFCLDFLEGFYCLPALQLTIVEPDGSTRMAD